MDNYILHSEIRHEQPGDRAKLDQALNNLGFTTTCRAIQPNPTTQQQSYRLPKGSYLLISGEYIPSIAAQIDAAVASTKLDVGYHLSLAVLTFHAGLDPL